MDPNTKTIRKIIGLDDSKGKLKYLIHFEGIEECDLIEAEEAYSMWPQFFLKYFEEKLTWVNGSSVVKNCVKNSIKTNNINVNDSKVVEKILGGINSGGQVFFLVQWRDTKESEFIEAQEAYIRCPKLVLEWYHDKIHLK
ncbi:chromobox protein homolog 5-like [Aphis gossypii]|uniref:chromobox protein homolog 5-like n=1 Tax=Aphis gossypii TaxID=80765 RepID=UPI00100DF9A4|nr:chromobox protein homolog 5-like [Aphis gossypii]